MKHPVRITLDIVCGKWKGLILWYLQEKPHRFGELKSMIPQVSHKMLTQQLRQLEQDGLVHRHVYDDVPPKVEYSLTTYGKDLEPTLHMLYKWGKAHMDKLESNEKETTI